MKYALALLFCIAGLFTKAGDTVYVETKRDPRYLAYIDSLNAYNISYSVAKNIADSVRRMSGSNALDAYFLSEFTGSPERSLGYYYEIELNVPVVIGHVNSLYKGMKNEAKFPWKYLEAQYKRLDSIKFQPRGVIQGGELPNVYVYHKPSTTYIYVQVSRYTVVGQIIKFAMTDGGKTKTPYIEKVYYSIVNKGHPQIDSIEKLDPVHKKHMFGMEPK